MQRSKHKSAIIIVVAIVLLCATIGITAFLNSKNVNHDTDGNTITISVNKKEVATYSMDELEKMNPQTISASLSSTGKDDIKGEFTGIPINKLLSEADENILDKCEDIIFIAGDGYSSALTSSEIKDNDTIMLAYKMNEKNIKHFNDGGEGPLRLIVGSDTYANRSTKFVVKIECK